MRFRLLDNFIRPNRFRLSGLTLGWAIFIILSASFMSQLWKFLSRLSGEDNLMLFCIVVIFIFATTVLIYIFKRQFSPIRLFAGITMLFLSFYFAWQQPYFVKRIHILEYSTLGLLTMRDYSKFSGINILKKVLFSVLFILVIACLDEGFQWFLPYRVGDIEDVMTNLIGGSTGTALFLLIK